MNRVFLMLLITTLAFSCTNSSSEKTFSEVVKDEKEKEKEEAIAVSHGEFTDSRDGKTYKTITINGQIWMNENLNFEIPDSSFCYQGKEENCDKYGRTYPWKTAQHACPEGWSLPTRKSWMDIEEKIEGDNSKKKIKVLEELEFNLQRAGQNYASWQHMDAADYFWLKNSIDNKKAENLTIYRDVAILGVFSEDKRYALSCRCVKDK